jgi:hypothetical protein
VVVDALRAGTLLAVALGGGVGCRAVLDIDGLSFDAGPATASGTGVASAAGGAGGTGGTPTTSTGAGGDGGPPVPIWNARFGDTAAVEAIAVAAGVDGSAVVAGHFTGTLDFGVEGPLASGGARNVFFVKLDAQGQPHCRRGFGVDGPNVVAADPIRIRDVAVGPGGDIAITGCFSGNASFGGPSIGTTAQERDIFVAKFTENCGHLHTAQLGQPGTDGECGNAVAFDGAGRVLVAARVSAPGMTDNAGLASLDGALGVVWAESLGDRSSVQQGLAVATDSEMSVYLGGEARGAIDLGGPKTAKDADAFLAGYDAAGAFRFAALGGGAGDDALDDLAVTIGDEILAVGRFAKSVALDKDGGGTTLTTDGGNATFVTRLDDAGKHLASRAFRDTNAPAWPPSVAPGADGGALVAGAFTGSSDFAGTSLVSHGAEDAYLVRFSAASELVYARRYGSEGSQVARGVATTAGGDAWVVGTFVGTIDFGLGPLVAQGGDSDMFVVRLAP